MSTEMIVFEDWERVLRETVLAEKQWEWREAVVKFRHWLRETGKEATAEAFREHLAWKKTYLAPEKFEIRRQALRWYWEKGRALQRSVVVGSGSVVGGQTREPASADKIPALRPEGPAGGKRVGPADNRGLAPNNQRPTTNNQMNDVPTKGAADLGGAPWGRKMVACIRARHLAWRTETTYRHWARRWVRFVENPGSGGRKFPNREPGGMENGPDSPRAQDRGGLRIASDSPAGQAGGGLGHSTSNIQHPISNDQMGRKRDPEELTGEDLKEFLSHLAVKERVSAATQRQAMNAGVFLIREVFGKEPGDFGDFARPPRHRNVPAVLSKDEVRRMFEQLSGTARLMAELMYGAGLRLNELLRLRVKDVDLERLQLSVRAGKGNKDRLTMVPKSLEARLREHRERLRELHGQDRAEGQPGVELPEAL